MALIWAHTHKEQPMTRTLLLTMAALLAACSEPVQFDRQAFESEYTACFKAGGHNYSDRNAKPTVYECRAAAMAVASYGE